MDWRLGVGTMTGLLMMLNAALLQAQDAPWAVPVHKILAHVPAGEPVTLGLVVRPAPEGFSTQVATQLGAASLDALQRDPRVAQVITPSDVAAPDMALAVEAGQHGVLWLVILRFDPQGPAAAWIVMDAQGVELHHVTRTLSQLAASPHHEPAALPYEEHDTSKEQAAPAVAPQGRNAHREPLADSGPSLLTDALLMGGGTTVGLVFLGVGTVLLLAALGVGSLTKYTPAGVVHDAVNAVFLTLACGGCASCCCGMLPFTVGGGAVGFRRRLGLWGMPAPTVILDGQREEQPQDDTPHAQDTAPQAAPQWGHSVRANPQHTPAAPQNHGDDQTPTRGPSDGGHGGGGGYQAGGGGHGSAPAPAAEEPKKKKPAEKEPQALRKLER